MRKLLLPLLFFLTTPLVITVGIVQFSYLHFHSGPFMSSNHVGFAYAALPTETNQITGEVNAVDAREARLALFFKNYNSPLENFAVDFVQAADKYGFDYRLLAAISMQESGGCRKEIQDSHNCFGYGIYGGKVMKFDNYSQAIDTVSKALSKYYINKGHDTIDEIQKIWNPSNHSEWKDKVQYFVDQI